MEHLCSGRLEYQEAGGPAGDGLGALQESVQLARLTDRLGYTRYWLSEHHNTTTLAGASPELMIARLAAETKNIRVGSGGIMLPNHSALKVAENVLHQDDRRVDDDAEVNRSDGQQVGVFYA